MSNPAAPRTAALFAVGVVLLVLGVMGALAGLAWVVTFYLSQGLFPIANLGSWNILIGLVQLILAVAFIVAGAVLARLGRGRIA